MGGERERGRASHLVAVVVGQVRVRVRMRLVRVRVRPIVGARELPSALRADGPRLALLFLGAPVARGAPGARGAHPALQQRLRSEARQSKLCSNGLLESVFRCLKSTKTLFNSTSGFLFNVSYTLTCATSYCH